ncbi:cytochrome P450 [Mycena leptocephala]|nr:cytochrome P450 [Mycena leptocephala]
MALLDIYNLIICATISLAIYFLRLRRNRLPLPPGPRKLPLVGNLFNLPSTFEWETYMQWNKRYSTSHQCLPNWILTTGFSDSDIIHLNVAGTSIIVLSSSEAAVNLLEKRARLPMVNELMGWDFNFGFMKYGEHWRAHRRLFHNALNTEAARLFRPKELTASHELLRRMLHNPDGFMDHFRHMAGEIIMYVAYGIDVKPANDPYVTLAEAAVHSLADVGGPGRFLVDLIPLLKYVPEWFPGAGFKRQASIWRSLARSMVDTPFAQAKLNIAMGNAPHSFMASALQTLEDCADKEYQEQTIKSTAGTMYTAGTDSTVSALGTFILAMLSNPEAQKKAQAEIDSVVQKGHLPDFDDEESLLYVSAVVKEVLRWRAVTPIGIPHFLSVEDEYRGYRLPASSLVIANTWAILHDEVMYPDPYEFKPERFLLDGKPNPAIRNPDAAFGFGRRMCPGRHMATSSVWIAVASILATFDITKAVGEDGKVIEPNHAYFPGLVTMPLPFKCSIKPRSQETVDIIQATLNEDLAA